MKQGFYGDLDTRWLTVAELKARGLDTEKSYAVLLSPLYFQVPGGPLIEIPAGLITDFASVPRIFWSVFPPYDPYYGAPAVLHDFGYSTQGTFELPGFKLPRSEVDQLFLEAMTLQDTERWRRNLMYAAVRLFGASTWSARHEPKKDWVTHR